MTPHEHRFINWVPTEQRTATNILNAWERHGWEVVDIIPSGSGNYDLWVRRPNENPPQDCWDDDRETWYDQGERSEG